MMRVESLGEGAATFAFDASDEDIEERVFALAAALHDGRLAGVEDVVPAFDAVTIFFDPARVPGATAGRRALALVHEWVETLAARPRETVALPQRRLVEIPTCYGGEDGPDLARVAAHCGMTPEALVAAHASALYEVVAVGFTPGFAYLGGLPAALRCSRLPTPRVRVPAGSLGIGESWTGVYPSVSPGGWNLIGRTLVPLFDSKADPPNRLQYGDRVRFRVERRRSP